LILAILILAPSSRNPNPSDANLLASMLEWQAGKCAMLLVKMIMAVATVVSAQHLEVEQAMVRMALAADRPMVLEAKLATIALPPQGVASARRVGLRCPQLLLPLVPPR